VQRVADTDKGNAGDGREEGGVDKTNWVLGSSFN